MMLAAVHIRRTCLGHEPKAARKRCAELQWQWPGTQVRPNDVILKRLVICTLTAPRMSSVASSPVNPWRPMRCASPPSDEIKIYRYPQGLALDGVAGGFGDALASGGGRPSEGAVGELVDVPSGVLLEPVVVAAFWSAVAQVLTATSRRQSAAITHRPEVPPRLRARPVRRGRCRHVARAGRLRTGVPVRPEEVSARPACVQRSVSAAAARGAGGGHAAAGGAGWLAERLQHAAIVAGNFTWNTTGGFQRRHPGQGEQAARGSTVHAAVSRALWRQAQQRTGLPSPPTWPHSSASA